MGMSKKGEPAFDAVVKGGLAVLPDKVLPLDIGISDGRIAALSESLDASAASFVVDAAGAYVLPGMIDAHVHFNEPNYGHWEGFECGSAALAAGGVTTYIDMPLNGNPPLTSRATFETKARLARGRSAVDYAFWGALVPGNVDKLDELASQGVVGFKAFMSKAGGEGEGRFREVDDSTLYEGMKRIASFGGLLALHAESDAITTVLAEDALRGHRTTALDYAASRPIEAETEAVERALLYAERTGCRLHFVHISSAAAVTRIEAAKRRGMDVSLETCPHYLVLTEEDMLSFGAIAKCAPPLRSAEERARLWTAIIEGRIDLVTSDHSPCPTSLKEQPFFDAWGGISGAQHSLELLFDEAVLKRDLPATLVASLASGAPAKRFGFPDKGEIRVGADADLAVLQPEPYTVTKEHLRYRHRHSPYIGREIGCRVMATMVRGRLVYTAEGGMIAPGKGHFVRPLG